jgi:Zn-dependent protease
VEADDVLRALLWFVVFLFSTTVHEAMHAFVAYRGGDDTAYQGGQVSLSPLPHIRREPIGMLVVPLLTAFTNGWALGWASTPYNPYWAAQYPRRAAAMAAAGPAGNLLIALGAFAVIKAGLFAGWFAAPERIRFSSVVAAAGNESWMTAVAQLLTVMLVLNVLLCVFNLLPVPPLDGGAALAGILPARAAAALQTFTSNPMFSILGILVAWQVFPYIARPLFLLVVRLVHPQESYF